MARRFARLALIGLLVLFGAAGQTAQASPIVAGFNSGSLAANDDLSTGLINLGFSFNFFGNTFSQAYVNNNGNITFNSPLGTFTPFGLTGGVPQPIIAPYFADVDTRVGPIVTYGTGTFDTHSAFGVNWLDVGYFSEHLDKRASFQLLLVDRADTGAGNADVYFNYGSIQWETGDASGGSGGFGGSCAHAGYSNGSGSPGTFFELPGSGSPCGRLVDGGANQLQTSTNDNVAGQWLFQVRNGEIIQPTTGGAPGVVPEPTSLLLLGSGLFGAAMRLRRKNGKG